MTRVRSLYSQLQPMRQMISKLKKDKDASKKVTALEKEMDTVLHKIQVTLMCLDIGLGGKLITRAWFHAISLVDVYQILVVASLNIWTLCKSELWCRWYCDTINTSIH